MAATETLTRIAESLPAQERERFLLMVARFKNVPEDDEYLQVVEAIGFMTLIWKDMPNQLATLLSQAQEIRHVLDEDQVKELSSGLALTLVEQLQLPSFEDLKRISHEMGQQQQALQAALQRVPTSGRVNSGSWIKTARSLVIALTVAATSVYLVHQHLWSSYGDRVEVLKSSVSEAEQLVGSLAASPCIGIHYFEGIDLSLKRPVRAIILDGPVIDAFQDEDGRGVIRLEGASE